MTTTLVKYLGKPASAILTATPFNQWLSEKSSEDDLEKPIINHVFPQHGLELRCDQDDIIDTIFVYSSEFSGFDEALLDVPFSTGRQQVGNIFGTPSKSGGPLNDPILGAYGAWDRFTRQGYTIHVEYLPHADRIKTITLIRADVVPK